MGVILVIVGLFGRGDYCSGKLFLPGCGGNIEGSEMEKHIILDASMKPRNQENKRSTYQFYFLKPFRFTVAIYEL
jgi:hypothetical protein